MRGKKAQWAVELHEPPSAPNRRRGSNLLMNLPDRTLVTPKLQLKCEKALLASDDS